MRSTGLTISQLGMLLNLNGSVDGKLPMKELEAALHVAQSTATDIASRLETKGMIASFGNPENKRSRWSLSTDSYGHSPSPMYFQRYLSYFFIEKLLTICSSTLPYDPKSAFVLQVKIL